MTTAFNMFYEPLPVAVNISGREYEILTDYREWIRFIDMMNDKEIPPNLKVMFTLKMFPGGLSLSEVELQDLLKSFSLFLACKTEDDDTAADEDHSPPQRKPQILSYAIDAPYIIAGFMQDYGIDLLTVDYMHWWKFRALLDGLRDDTEIKRRMYYRSIDTSKIKSKEERKRIRRIQAEIRLPQEVMSDEEIANAFI